MPPINQTAEAMAAWRKAADKGSTSAMVELGVLYGTGAGVAKDEETGAQIVRARGRGRQSARRHQSRRARRRRRGGRSGASRELLAKAAETNAEAQYQLGLMLADGTGGAKDDVRRTRAVREGGGAKSSGRAGADGRVRARRARRPKGQGRRQGLLQRAAALGDENAKAALKQMDCPITIKDKRGNFVTNLCF